MAKSFLDLPDGVHPNVSPHTYHQRHLGLVSKSALDLIRRSPAHYKAWLDGEAEEEETPALAFGRAFHCALLEPERFDDEYAAEPDFGDCRNKENKAKRDEWRDAHAAHELISIADERAIRGMVAAVRRHKLAGKMIRDGVSELTLKWTDPNTGLTCKSRLDYYVESLGMIVDAKSCLDARSGKFRRQMIDHGYELQDALYRSAALTLGLRVQHFVFLAVEKSPPYAPDTYSLEERGIASGYSKARFAIDKLAECMQRNEWPGYDVGIKTIEWPEWAL